MMRVQGSLGGVAVHHAWCMLTPAATVARTGRQRRQGLISAVGEDEIPDLKRPQLHPLVRAMGLAAAATTLTSP
jgi:hypothetical protein